MALSSSYPVAPSAGVGPPGTSSSDYGLLAKSLFMGHPFLPMTIAPPVTWRPPTHGVLPSTAGAVSTAPPAPSTTTAPPASTTTPLSSVGGFVTGIPGGSTLLGGSGIPMPVVPGYKYVYPWYKWRDASSSEDAGYELRGHKEDRDTHAYFPYFPGTPEERAYSSAGDPLKDILVGVSLIRS